MNIIKSVISIKTIMTIRLFCGFYYKISSNKVVDIIMRAYCVFVATTLILQDYTITKDYPFLAKLRYVIQGTVYATNVFINLLFSGENIFGFLKKISKVTPGLKLNDQISISRILFIFLLLGKVITYVLFCIITPDSRFNGLSAATLRLAFDMSQHTSNFTRIIMFELLWHRMAMLPKQLEKCLSVTRRFQEGEEVMKKKIRSCLKSYKNLLNSTHETDAPMKFMIFSSIVMLIPKILNTIYLLIAYKNEYYSSVLYVYETLLEFTVTLSPALLAEMVNSEIDKIKLCVIKQLLVCRGETTRDAIDDAMMYLHHRPFKYTIWRLFTLDMSVILSVIALITTCIVAMIQFAHFYD